MMMNKILIVLLALVVVLSSCSPGVQNTGDQLPVNDGEVPTDESVVTEPTTEDVSADELVTEEDTTLEELI